MIAYTCAEYGRHVAPSRDPASSPAASNGASASTRVMDAACGRPFKATLPVGKQTLKFVPAEGPSKSVSVDVKESGGAARFDLEDL